MNNITSEGRFKFETLLKVPIPTDIERFDIQKDDVIFNNTNSLDLIGKAAIAHEGLKYTFSNHLTRIRVKKKILSPCWLYLLLLHYRNRAVFRAICNTHVGQSGIGKNELSRLLVFFSSIEEQNKITSIISRVDYLIQKLDQIIEQTQRLKEGLVQTLLIKGIGHNKFKKTELGEIPEEWKISKLREHITKIGSGITPRGGSRVYRKEGIPLIRSQNVHFDGLRIEDAAYISEEIDEEMRSSRVHPHDVLLNITGASIGRCTVVPETLHRGNVNQHVCIIRPTPEINSRYLAAFLSSGRGQNMIHSSHHGLSREGLTFSQIGSFPIPIPTIEEQEKIVRVLTSVNKWIEVQNVSKLSVEKLKKGLMQKLLTGKIRVKA